mmetsp:Transcript_12284/g.21921  ORF Transcript_12284/g.21921 Transcript_12284/m.21921 type:complete len:266 (-) Transcript_12284:219-1016(-)|eukprot:CAMPEP_0184547592 /NCGR_PEP_ID=MMETSP0199_2-20130426/5671_1 /TAXON_ID=1112570 /ORGANISM="Thraustochytrium sp., Strain LLF1b" /LENGTH=265 /DNA_ID=CAMNT_0026942107 /DNA_START=195 /DNA_END=992 /DNA_ORIENTATION=-
MVQLEASTPPLVVGNRASGNGWLSQDSFTFKKLIAARIKFLSRPSVPPQSEKDEGKITLVLDLDECLIHSVGPLNSTEVAESNQLDLEQGDAGPEDEDDSVSPDNILLVPQENGSINKVYKRPGLDEFLQAVKDQFEVCVYTAGLEHFASPILDLLDPDGSIFRHRLYREDCILTNGIYVKDLMRFNRQMSRIVLVDNNAMCFLPQLSNGIPISSFYDDENDTALSSLLDCLECIRDGEEDIRPFLRKNFRLESLLSSQRHLHLS